MFYGSTPETPGHKIHLDELNGRLLKEEIKELVDSIINDEREQKTKSPLEAESLVIAIHGGWGAGKTTAAWALINHLWQRQEKERPDRQVHIQSFNLLPFGNINGSLNNILNTIANHLWRENLLDVRKEFGRMLADATLQSDINAEIEFLGLKLKRRISLGRKDLDYKGSLERKFADFKAGGHKLVIMIDDLDRMRPDEVIIVTRMVENFRKVPGIIFVLPFRRRTVASAIGQALKLDGPDSHVYLRKMIKSSITIDLTLENLRDSFVETFRQEATGIPRQLLKLDSALVVWYMLLHVILLSELIESIRIPDRADANLSLESFLQSKSDYLPKLLGVFRSSTYAVEKQDAWHPLVEEYNEIRFIAEQLSFPVGTIAERVGNSYKQLSRLLDGEELHLPLCPKNTSASQNRRDCQCPQPTKHPTFFSSIILPSLENSRHEALLADEYSRRDMEQLASAIRRDLHFSPAGDIAEDERLKQWSAVIKSRFLEFR